MANPATYKTAPNVLQLSINGHMSNGNRITNIWYAQASPAPDVPACEAYATSLQAAWITHMLSLITVHYFYDNIKWLLLTTTDSPSGTVAPAPGESVDGNAAATAAPPNVAALITKLAGATGRRARNGRMFLCGINEAEIDALGTFNTASMPTHQAVLDAFFDAINTIAGGASSWTACQPHWFKSNKPAVEVGGVWPSTSVTGLSGLQLQAQVATQRRRLRG